LLGEQIEEQGAIAGFTNDARDELIARTVPAAAAAMSEDHHTLCRGRNLQFAAQTGRPHSDAHSLAERRRLLPALVRNRGIRFAFHGKAYPCLCRTWNHE